MIYFANIIIQEKSQNEDYRSFAHFTDNDGNKWEIRGYGATPGIAADDAYTKFKDNENWDLYGYIISS
jgi:hypothetical protein